MIYPHVQANQNMQMDPHAAANHDRIKAMLMRNLVRWILRYLLLVNKDSMHG